MIRDSDVLLYNDVQRVKWESGESNKYQVAVGADLRFKQGCCVCGGCCVVTKGNCSSGRKVVRGPGDLSHDKFLLLLYCILQLNKLGFLRALIACRPGSDWKWANQDGGSGKTGVLQDSSVDSDGWIVSSYVPFCSCSVQNCFAAECETSENVDLP